MPNLATAIRYLARATRDPANPLDLTDQFAKRDNATFLAEVARQLQELAKTPGPGGTTFDGGGIGCIGLMGEYGLIGYGIRGAQELIRADHEPSYWSHAFLVTSALSTEETDNRSAARSAWIWESTLEPATPFNHFANRNGVAPRRISDYARAKFDLFAAHSVPNIAVIAFALTPKEREAILDRADDPAVDMLHYDISGLLGTWYAYLTDQASKPNPLSTGFAIYCSAYVQLAYDAAGIDLSPGASQKNTSPEHLWQTACYLRSLFEVYDETKKELVPRPIQTWYCVRDWACLVAPIGQSVPRRLTDVIETLAGE